MPLHSISLSRQLQLAEAAFLYASMLYGLRLSFLSDSLVNGIGKVADYIDAVTFAFATGRHFVDFLTVSYLNLKTRAKVLGVASGTVASQAYSFIVLDALHKAEHGNELD